MKKILFGFILLTLSSFATAEDTSQQPLAESMSATFYNMEDDLFSFQAIAPTEVILEYAICKAVWFAEKKQAMTISLSNPIFNSVPKEPETSVPNGWATVDAIVYLNEQCPSCRLFLKIPEIAEECRSGWDWYL